MIQVPSISLSIHTRVFESFTMWKRIFILFLFCLIQLSIVQSELDLTFLDSEISNISPEYINDYETFVNNDNAGIYMNVSIIKAFPESARLAYTLRGAALGEYVLRTGMDLDIKLCDAFTPNYRMIGDQIENIGLRGDNCPPTPGSYGSENLAAAMQNLPDAFPPNNYLAMLKIYTFDQVLFELRMYVRLAI